VSYLVCIKVSSLILKFQYLYTQIHFSSLLSERTSVTVQHGRTKKGKVAPKVSGTTYFNQTSSVKEPLSGDFMVVCCKYF
jgi:hypothetical protein